MNWENEWEHMDTLFVDDVPNECWDGLTEIDLDEIGGDEYDDE